MTLHRYLASGKLRWRGSVRRGRLARGIDLHECQALIGRQPDRAIASASVEAKMLRWIRRRSPFCHGADWRAVMSHMMAAAVAGDADADLLLYAARCLLRHDNDFLYGLLMDGRRKSTAAFAGRAIVACALELPKLDTGLTFRQAWRLFIQTARGAQFSARPVLVYESDRRLARLVLSPRWVYETPKHHRHDVSASMSFYQVQGRNRAIMEKLSLRLASAQFDNAGLRHDVQAVPGDAMTYIPDDMTLTSGRSAAFRNSIKSASVDLPAWKLYGAAVSAILAPDVYQDYDETKQAKSAPEWLPKLAALGLSKSESQVFARTLRRMAGVPDSRRRQKKTDQHGRDIDSKRSKSLSKLDNRAKGRQISISVLSRALGVSRLTVRRWLRSLHSVEEKKPMSLQGAEPCPACGEGLIRDDGKYHCPACAWVGDADDLDAQAIAGWLGDVRAVID